MGDENGEARTTGEIRIVDGRPSTGDRLWDVFLKALPVIIIALVGWAVRIEITTAQCEARLDRIEQEVASVRDLERKQDRLEVRLETIEDSTRAIRKALEHR